MKPRMKISGKHRYAGKAALKRKSATPKSEVTKKMILEAARRVFEKQPYQSATLRMIGKEGGFHFTLINHYFSKAQLFEAVAAQSLQELFDAFTGWINGLENLTPGKGLSLFLDRALHYLFQQPGAMLLLIHNISMEGGRVSIPGFDVFTSYVANTGNKMIQDFPLAAGKEQVVMWVHSLINMLISLVGFSSYHGKVLDMDPSQEAYRKWVKDCLMYCFLPPLRSMFLPLSSTLAPTVSPMPG